MQTKVNENEKVCSQEFLSDVEMQVARGRLKGLLNEIMEEPDAVEAPPKVTSNRGRPRRPKDEGSSSTSIASKPYVIKLFDRLVNVSQFDENSPLYPICREWFYDKKTEKAAESPSGDSNPTYYTGKEPLLKQLQKGRIDRVAALPPPNDDEVVQKVPYCEPPALENGLHLFSVDYVSLAAAIISHESIL